MKHCIGVHHVLTWMHVAAAVVALSGSPATSASTHAGNCRVSEPSSEGLWPALRSGFGLPALKDELIGLHETRYASNPGHLQSAISRASPYLHYIVDELRRRGMPTELALLPMVESGFDPDAVSPAMAAGLWQFMPATGNSFNLPQTERIDKRKDVRASTRAALDYLTQLHAQFGDWPLALAAYNWGEGKVKRAVDAQVAKGLAADFVDLTLPQETRQYVPRLYALRNIVLRPADFGVHLPLVPDQPYFVEVALAAPASVRRAASMAGVPPDAMRALNPAAHSIDTPLEVGTAWLVPCRGVCLWCSRRPRVRLDHS
jgi:membrane-bound lytic murein transglycosylase D